YAPARPGACARLQKGDRTTITGIALLLSLPVLPPYMLKAITSPVPMHASSGLSVSQNNAP
ncbi:MAG: hypothetical protein IIV41_03315, partial [Akkermansia sp.]|nr:hypothetical protein [Akkermansia sp.]